MRFRDKVVIITGAAGEIAQEMTRSILREGGYVVAVGLYAAPLDRFLESLKDEGFTQYKRIIADISSRERMDQVVDQVMTQLCRIDILINHVGVAQAESLQSTTVPLWESDIQINLNGTYYITNAVLAHMKTARKGTIITIGSINSDRAVGNPAYSAAKAGLVSYMQAIATEYGQYNIRANTVSPGSVHTHAWDARIQKQPDIFVKLLKWYPLRRIATPQSISHAVLFLASDEADCISGINLRVDAGLSAGMALFARDITSEDFGV